MQIQLRWIVAAVAFAAIAGCDDGGASIAEPDEAAAGGDYDIGESLLTAAEAAKAASSPTPLERRLTDALLCHSRPEPTPILIEMIEQGIVQPEPQERFDSVSCFNLERPMTLAGALPDTGLTVRTVCAHDEGYYEAGEALPHKELFVRGPGTSPGQLISAYLDGPVEVVSAWMRANGAHENSRLLAWEDSSLSHKGEGTRPELTCNRLD